MRDLQDILVSPTCLECAPGVTRAFLYLRPGYVPKILNNAALAAIVFQDPTEVELGVSCANIGCIHMRPQWRKSFEQLFVCFGSHRKDFPATNKP